MKAKAKMKQRKANQRFQGNPKKAFSNKVSVSLNGFIIKIPFWLDPSFFELDLFLFAESPAEFFAENKNIAGFDNVSFSS